MSCLHLFVCASGMHEHIWSAIKNYFLPVLVSIWKSNQNYKPLIQHFKEGMLCVMGAFSSMPVLGWNKKEALEGTRKLRFICGHAIWMFSRWIDKWRVLGRKWCNPEVGWSYMLYPCSFCSPRFHSIKVFFFLNLPLPSRWILCPVHGIRLSPLPSSAPSPCISFPSVKIFYCSSIIAPVNLGTSEHW